MQKYMYVIQYWPLKNLINYSILESIHYCWLYKPGAPICHRVESWGHLSSIPGPIPFIAYMVIMYLDFAFGIAYILRIRRLIWCMQKVYWNMLQIVLLLIQEADCRSPCKHQVIYWYHGYMRNSYVCFKNKKEWTKWR